MSITLTTKLTSSIDTPIITRSTIFVDRQTGNLAMKKPSGNVMQLGGGQRIETYSFGDQENADIISNKFAGSLYLQSGSLSISSSIYFGTLAGTGQASCKLYREDTNNLIATWTIMTGQLQNIYLSASAPISQDAWYSVKFKMDSGTDTAILKGLRLVFE